MDLVSVLREVRHLLADLSSFCLMFIFYCLKNINPTFFFAVSVTIPQGDIILQDGDPLELYCVLNLTHPATKGRNASHLTFYRENKKISSDYLKVLNETTLMLSMTPKVSYSMYYCRLEKWEGTNEEAVCLNNVAVGCKLPTQYFSLAF